MLRSVVYNKDTTLDEDLFSIGTSSLFFIAQQQCEPITGHSPAQARPAPAGKGRCPCYVCDCKSQRAVLLKFRVWWDKKKRQNIGTTMATAESFPMPSFFLCEWLFYTLKRINITKLHKPFYIKIRNHHCRRYFWKSIQRWNSIA